MTRAHQNIKQFVICGSDYDPHSGGNIALHLLAYQLAELGFDVSFAPGMTLQCTSYKDLSLKNLLSRHFRARRMMKKRCAPKPGPSKVSYITGEEAKALAERRDTVFVYSEICIGNPYDAQKVVIWLLHFPMYFTKHCAFREGDIVVPYSSAVEEFSLPGTVKYPGFLRPIEYPQAYQGGDPNTLREHTCYLVRKGKGKKFIHPDNSICIDGLSHAEAASTFLKSKYFYCYDTLSAYAYFSIIQGCIPIVIPDKGVDINEWHKDEKDRLGIAYGEENIPFAIETRQLMLKHIKEIKIKSKENVRIFAEFIENH